MDEFRANRSADQKLEYRKLFVIREVPTGARSKAVRIVVASSLDTQNIAYILAQIPTCYASAA